MARCARALRARPPALRRSARRRIADRPVGSRGPRLDGRALLGSDRDRTGTLYFDIAVDPTADTVEVQATLAEAGRKAASARGCWKIFTSANEEAPRLESYGFAPTLLVQARGEDRAVIRDEVVRDLRSKNRILSLREWGGEVAQAVFRTDRVEQELAAGLSLPGWRRYSTWLMWQWADPAAHPRHIVSFHDRYARSTVGELKEVDPDLEAKAKLHGGQLEVEAGRPGHDLAPAIKAEAPVFLHHLMPVEAEILTTGTRKDLAALIRSGRTLRSLRREVSFAVECRKGRDTAAGPHAEAAYAIRDVEVQVGTALAADGFVVDMDQPGQILSIYLDRGRALLGRAGAVWADEPRRRLAVPTVCC